MEWLPCQVVSFQLSKPTSASKKRPIPGRGRYTVSWDGLDEAGKPLSSGVYLMRLKALSRVETRKMTLMK